MTRQATRRGAPGLLVRTALFTAVLGALLLGQGCGGSVGVADGTIVGQVFGDLAGGGNEPIPLDGVTVVAQRTNGEPPVIRSATTDGEGRFVLTNMPTGEYSIGYAKRGFNTIDTSQGATNDRTALGEQVRVFIEADTTSVAPDVTLSRLPEEGDSTVVITLRDIFTADPVTNATITVGAATTSDGGSNGVYSLNVPVTIPDGQSVPTALAININAEGYTTMGFVPNMVTPIANQTVAVTVQIQPVPSTISGFVEISEFQPLFDRSQINVTVEGLPTSFTGNANNAGQGARVVDASGFFNVAVPASTTALTRQFTLVFDAPNLVRRRVPNVVSPVALSTRQLTAPIVMEPLRIDLVGTVIDSSGNPPNQQGALPDTVTVNQTGQVGNIVNGSYTIVGVPATDPAVGPQTYSLFASVFNPLLPGTGGQMGVQEEGTQENVTPVPDGTANPTFTVRLIQTAQAGGS